MEWTDREVEGADLTLLRCEKMERCRLVRCDLRSARLSELQTTGCSFEECNFSGASLSSSKHRGTAFLNCDLSGADLFGADLEHCRMVGSIFADTVLTAARVKGGDWSAALLRMQDLAGFDLTEMKLEGADLYGANLANCALRFSTLSNANLQHAKLTEADLRGADISGVDFRGVEVKGARMSLDQAVAFAISYGVVVE
ncbi:MAG TPA: pentapeptide repeat-containing protein [Fimbriimonadaceae bacterium]|nr:pentapeptide repeat-containing protein [Fimbriimonadaceae bacterium]